MSDTRVEDLLRQLAPRVLGTVTRWSGGLDGAEDATQEALLAAARHWPVSGLLERVSGGNPMVTLNRAIAAAMVHGPVAGLGLLEPLGEPLGDHYRLHAVRGHLFEMLGDHCTAYAAYAAAAPGTRSVPERNYLTAKAAQSRRRCAQSPLQGVPTVSQGTPTDLGSQTAHLMPDLSLL